MVRLTDSQAMELALSAARKGTRGANPLVGAVILSADGRHLVTGWHRGAGTPHAEADAIAQAHAEGIDLAGTRMLVTLEPCNHTGRTGPCSHAIAHAGISEVIYAYGDSTDQAAGGADYLRSQGITVSSGLRAQESFALNRRWFQAQAAGRPFITGKIASSLDGFIAASDGTSQWITGAQARQDGHALRSRVDAIAVGTATVRADNPQLTARRDGQLAERQPLRVVIGQSSLPVGSYLQSAVAAGKALHYRTRELTEVFSDLYSRGVRHLMIEGGPTLLTACLTQDLVDELYWYRAPLLLGAGKPALGDLGIASLSQAARWELDALGTVPALRQLGADTAAHLLPAFTSSP